MATDGPYVCRRLIILLDGTWNDADEAGPATNIVYLRELLFWGLQRRFDRKLDADKADYAKLDDEHKRKAASGLIFDGFEYVVHYGRGVGTSGFVDRVKGGVLGIGLDQDIRRAYKFLSYWFRPGDEIFIFGFSRGAFTARSLGGYLNAVGLLRHEFCSKENEQRAWEYYRTAPQDRVSADWEHFRKSLDAKGTTLVHDDDKMRVRAMCVFDTVGALGVPGNLFRQLNRSKYAFHDTDVSTCTDIRLHAVAIDEPRPEFTAAVWTKPKFVRFNDKVSPTEQVWFPGAHADIGGGYVQWADKGNFGLSHLPLAWMLQRLNFHLSHTDPLAEVAPPKTPAVEPRRHALIPFFLKDFFQDDEGKIIKDSIRRQVTADQHKSWELVSLLRKNNVRVINQVPVTTAAKLQTEGRIQHADPIGEMIHISAFERRNKTVKSEKDDIVYQPDNLLAAIPFIAASYLSKAHPIDTPWVHIVKPIFAWQRIRVVDWDGTPLAPGDPKHISRVFEMIPTPADIGITKMPREMDNFVLPDRPDPILTEQPPDHPAGSGG